MAFLLLSWHAFQNNHDTPMPRFEQFWSNRQEVYQLCGCLKDGQKAEESLDGRCVYRLVLLV
jgi:hypothetical protein